MSLKTYHRAHAEPLINAFLEGYRRERLLPEGYQKYHATFAAIHMVERTNGQLARLHSESTARLAYDPRGLLSGTVEWLKNCYVGDHRS